MRRPPDQQLLVRSSVKKPTVKLPGAMR